MFSAILTNIFYKTRSIRMKLGR